MKLLIRMARRSRKLSDKQFHYFEQLLDKAGINGRLHFVSRLPTGSGAELYHFKIASEGKTPGYFAKFHPDAHLPIEERRSFHAYQVALRLAPFFMDVSSDFVVPTPTYYDVPSACLITEAIEGKSIHDLIRDRGRLKVELSQKSDLKDAVKNIAGWLKCLWRVTGSGERKVFCVSSLNHPPWSWDDKLRKCYKSKFVTSSVAESLRLLLIKKMEALDGIEYPLVGGHWDFRPANVVVSGSRVIVIDWTTYRPCRTPYWDAAGFWADLGNISINPKVRSTLIRSLQNSFAEALATELNSELFWVWRVEAVLYFAARDTNSRNARELGDSKILVKWFSRIHYRRALAELAKEAEER